MAQYRKTSNRIASPKELEYSQDYSKFDSIDGDHPLKEVVPDSVVEYKVRIRPGGKVKVFNFAMARKMGLIDNDHPDVLTSKLEEKILETFGIIIINEFDEINNRKFPKEQIKEKTYMATRYLQLQHPNKQGKTSGDGRSIWNGHFKGKGLTWDISSCGTGATKLSPATAINNKYYQSGDPSISYGCGYSEVDEGLSTLFFSEVLRRNHIPTERVLAIIEYPKNISINVRVHDNLIRPSHMFCYLKQEDFENAKRILDYYIDRQVQNKKWHDCPKKDKQKYDYFLNKVSSSFAQIAADFEDEYIFCWLDWDGDNILMDGSILDYGSVRQFGLFHHEYRYDDNDRFSTTIIEQKQKARYTVQTFVQLVDFILDKKRRPVAKFSSSKFLKNFDEEFIKRKDYNILKKIGFNPKDIEFLSQKYLRTVQKFRKCFSYFEKAKSQKGMHKVPDGVTWDAIFCMRDILRELPQLLLNRKGLISEAEFIDILASNYASPEDLKISTYRKKKVVEYQKLYISLIQKVSKKSNTSFDRTLLSISMRSNIINKYDRVTGDSISTIVDRVLSCRPKLSPDQLYELLEEFCHFQILDPDQKLSEGKQKVDKKILKGILEIVRNYREGL